MAVPPHGIVAAHLVAGFLVVFHFHPLGVDSIAVHVTDGACFPQIGDEVAVLIPDTVGIVILQAGGEGIGVLVLAEFPQAVPIVAFDFLRALVHAQELAVLAEHGGVFPALHLKHDGKQADAPLVAFGDEVPVVHEAVHLHAGIHRAKGLVVQIGQGNAAAAQARPGEHRAVVLLQVLQHLLAADGQTGMVAVVVLEPAVKIDAAFHNVRPLV